MGRRIQIGRGAASIKVDDGLHDAIERAINEGFKATADGLEAEAKHIFDHAHANWPVKTGRSKKALRYGLQFLPPRTLKSTVYVDPESEAASYVYYIKGLKHGGKSTWVTLVRKPANDRKKELAKELAVRFRYSVGTRGRMKG